MAAIAYPVQAGRSTRPNRPHLYLVPPPPAPDVRRAPVRAAAASVRPVRRSFALRRLAVAGATVAALATVWFGAGALRSAEAAAESGGAALRPGAVYVVRSGDTLWSIASRIDPSGDPRPLVDELGSELHGASLQPGLHLRIP